MELTPQVLRNAQFRQAFRGYDPDDVDDLLERAAVAPESRIVGIEVKTKLAEAKTKLKGMQSGKKPKQVNAEASERLSPGERKIRRAMNRFDHLQAQVDNLEARVRSYEVGGTVASTWSEAASQPADPAIEEELARMKARVAKSSDKAPADNAGEESAA